MMQPSQVRRITLTQLYANSSGCEDIDSELAARNVPKDGMKKEGTADNCLIPQGCGERGRRGAGEESVPLTCCSLASAAYLLQSHAADILKHLFQPPS